MKTALNITRFVVGVACLSVPTVAMAQECTRGSGTIEYCKCLYDQALQKIMDAQGNDNVGIRKRIEALGKAMKKCLIDGGTDEVTEEIKRV